MSINDLLEKIKPFYTILLIVVIASIFFALGRLSAIKQDSKPIKIVYPNTDQAGLVVSAVSDQESAVLNTSSDISQSGEVIGSRSGKKYYFPWCGTVKKIKPENQVHFSSINEAQKAGFTAGGNCKGLK
ncbi:MAG: hypothetical protein AB201_03175 [Parcubacteria bacterium C7867-006]|nr:MAG: hypothetical protein AB201_03175 [Parcubacteria bacterium C7867-006]